MFLHDFRSNVPSTEYSKPDSPVDYSHMGMDWTLGTLDKITTNTTDNPWNWVLGLPRPGGADIAKTTDYSCYKLCLESAVKRQLYFPSDDNYFSRFAG